MIPLPQGSRQPKRTLPPAPASVNPSPTQRIERFPSLERPEVRKTSPRQRRRKVCRAVPSASTVFSFSSPGPAVSGGGLMGPRFPSPQCGLFRLKEAGGLHCKDCGGPLPPGAWLPSERYCPGDRAASPLYFTTPGAGTRWQPADVPSKPSRVAKAASASPRGCAGPFRLGGRTPPGGCVGIQSLVR